MTLTYIRAPVRSQERNSTETNIAITINLFCELIKYKFHKFSHLWLVIRITCLMMSVSNDAAYCAGIVSQMSRYSGNC